MDMFDDWFDDDETGKKKKKKKKKESDPEIIEMLGGKKAYRQLAEGLEQYVSLFDRMIIVQDMSPDETEKAYKDAMKMIKDMKNLRTDMFDKEAVERYCERMDKLHGK